MTRLPQVPWERQGWVMAGPEVSYDKNVGRPFVPWFVLRQAQDANMWAQNAALEQGQRSGHDPSTSSGNVRIGDSERDQAISSLGDHFAAGRLTREEFDERSDQAMQARYGADLQPLFADLPRPVPAIPPQTWPTGSRSPFLLMLWLMSLLLVIAVIGAVVLSAPWLVWMFLTIFLIVKFSGRRRSGYGHRNYHQFR
jgi:hypothetical protein